MTNLEKRRNRSLREEAEQIYRYEDNLNDEICKRDGDCPFGDDVEPENCIACIEKWLTEEAEE